MIVEALTAAEPPATLRSRRRASSTSGPRPADRRCPQQRAMACRCAGSAAARANAARSPGDIRAAALMTSLSAAVILAPITRSAATRSCGRRRRMPASRSCSGLVASPPRSSCRSRRMGTPAATARSIRDRPARSRAYRRPAANEIVPSAEGRLTSPIVASGGTPCAAPDPFRSPALAGPRTCTCGASGRTVTSLGRNVPGAVAMPIDLSTSPPSMSARPSQQHERASSKEPSGRDPKAGPPPRVTVATSHPPDEDENPPRQASRRSAIASRCSGVVPQQPPTIVAPASRIERAWIAISEGADR